MIPQNESSGWEVDENNLPINSNIGEIIGYDIKTGTVSFKSPIQVPDPFPDTTPEMVDADLKKIQTLQNYIACAALYGLNLPKIYDYVCCQFGLLKSPELFGEIKKLYVKSPEYVKQHAVKALAQKIKYHEEINEWDKMEPEGADAKPIDCVKECKNAATCAPYINPVSCTQFTSKNKVHCSECQNIVGCHFERKLEGNPVCSQSQPWEFHITHIYCTLDNNELQHLLEYKPKHTKSVETNEFVYHCIGGHSLLITFDKAVMMSKAWDRGAAWAKYTLMKEEKECQSNKKKS
jgi:hypothetical protein